MTEAIEGEIVETNTDGMHPDAIELGGSGRPGRPTDMTPYVVTKLIAAFHNGYNITEACGYADITRTTFYRWLEKDDQFSYKMSQAQAQPNRKAKEVVIQAIDQGDANLAIRYLTLRDPDFKPKAEITDTTENKETRAKIKGFLDDTNDSAYNDASGQSTSAAEPDSGEQVA